MASILTVLSTQELLAVASVSRRFYSLVARILHRRLLRAAPLPGNELIFECYHPSAKLSTPYLSCRYLGTVTRDGAPISQEAPALTGLQRLYSSFRPVVAEENRRSRNRPGQPVRQPSAAGQGGEADAMATEDLYLDEGELFSQLCAVTNVVKEGPRRGLFVSHVNISEGVIRVWRGWLAHAVGATLSAEDALQYPTFDDVLWVDTRKDVGVRFRVTLSASGTMPLLAGPGDEPPILYKLEYAGESSVPDHPDTPNARTHRTRIAGTHH